MTASRPPLELYRLIESLAGNPEARRRLKDEPEALFEEFKLPAAHRDLLRADPEHGLMTLGAHPNMQFKYLGALGRMTLKPASVRQFLAHAKARHGVA